jgi:CheY-like chemotaxis protein
MPRILIIDDDKSFRQALADSIRDFGHDVAEAANVEQHYQGEAALETGTKGSYQQPSVDFASQ